MSYTPNNIYVYLQAFSGAVAGLLGQSKSLVTTPRGANTDTIDIAGAWAQEVDAQWGVSTNPDLFEYEEILNFSTELFQAINPQPSSRSTSPATYTSTVEALMVLLEDGEAYLSSQSITPPSIVSQTEESVLVWRPLVRRADERGEASVRLRSRAPRRARRPLRRAGGRYRHAAHLSQPQQADSRQL